MFAFINQRLSIGLRLAIVGGIFTLFAVGVAGLNVMTGLDRIAFAQKELRGASYAEKIWQFVLSSNAVTMVADNALMNGHEAFDAEFGTAKEAAAALAATKNTPRRNAVITLLTKIANAANIELDPNSDSYYIGLAYTKDIGLWQSGIDDLYQSNKLKPSEARTAAITAAVKTYKMLKNRVDEDFGAIFKHDRTGETTRLLKPITEALEARGADMVASAEANANNQPTDFNAAKAAFKVPLNALVKATGKEFVRLVGVHVEDANTAMYTSLAVTLAIVIPALLLIVYITLGLTKRFKGLDEAMTRLGKGDKTVEVPYLDDTNETGRIAATLARMKQDIIEREATEQQREVDRIAAEKAQKAAEEEAQRRSEQLVVGTFGQGLKALAEERLEYRLAAEVPTAYRGLKDDFNQAMTTAEENRKQREEDAKQRERDRIAAEEAQKTAEEATRKAGIELVVSSFGEGMRAMAQRNLTYRLDKNLPVEYRGLQRDFNDAISQLETAMKEIRASAGEIAQNCHEISQGAREMAQRTEHQAASLEETAAAVNQITTTVSKSAEGASVANSRADNAKTGAERGNEIANKAVEAMRMIAKSSSEITHIIGVIDEIAFQTNLLALNAGVEAARAGDAGKGFAVVAFEVRALAQRSAGAAKEIKQLIKTSEAQVDTGVKLVEESGVALQKIVTDIGTITQLVAEIAHSQREQANALGEIDTAVAEMDKTTQQNAAMAEESNAASEALAGFAKDMETLVSRFNISDAEEEQPEPAASVAA